MPRKKANIHYLYKTTCVITGRYYIGMHSTANLEDGYMGSGKRLRYSLRKYGVENHIKEILEFFDSRELLIEAEKKAITSEQLEDKMCMNLCFGGNGGYISKEGCKKGGKSAGNIFKERIKNDKDFAKKQKEKFIKIVSESHKLGKYKYDFWKDKNFSKEHKKKIGVANSIKQKGSLNSQYGTVWITKDGENKKIKKEDLNSWINNGWTNGRTRKK